MWFKMLVTTRPRCLSLSDWLAICILVSPHHVENDSQKSSLIMSLHVLNGRNVEPMRRSR